MDEKIAQLLRSSALKFGRPEIKYAVVRQLLERTAEAEHDQEIRHLLAGGSAAIDLLLEKLAEQKACTLARDEKGISAVLIPQFYRDLVSRELEAIENSPESPFPTDQSFSVKIPDAIVATIDVKTGFADLLHNKDGVGQEIVRLAFPDNFGSILALTDSLNTKLMEYAAYKAGLYLKDGRNSTYIHNKMVGILPGAAKPLTDMIASVLNRPKAAAATLLEPSEFSFKFWAHFASLLLQDIRAKSERLVQEVSFCQAAYLIGFYIVFRKGVVQREATNATDQRTLERQLHKPPYAYTLDEIFTMKDTKGSPFVDKYSRQFVTDLLEQKTKAPDGGSELPEIVRLHARTPKGKEYFVPREAIVSLFLKNLIQASHELRDLYLTEWMTKIRDRTADPALKLDDAFELDLQKKLTAGYPLLDALLDTHLLYVAKETTTYGPQFQAEIGRCFTKDHRLKPTSELLSLSRKNLYAEARNRLPILLTAPLLSGLIALLKALFKGRKRKPKPAEAETTKPTLKTIGKRGTPAAARPEAPPAAGKPGEDPRKALERAVARIEEQLLPEGKDLRDTLDELAEKWNPLVDPSARSNLVDDVNSLIRDYLRGVKRSLLVRPPDAERIANLATELAGARSLEKIKKKDALRSYIQLYMLACLRKM